MGNNNQKKLTQESSIQSRSIKLTDGTIRAAVRLWCEDPTQATAKYGHIEEWDTSEVTDMADLFYLQTEFNSQMSRLNVSPPSPATRWRCVMRSSMWKTYTATSACSYEEECPVVMPSITPWLLLRFYLLLLGCGLRCCIHSMYRLGVFHWLTG